MGVVSLVLSLDKQRKYSNSVICSIPVEKASRQIESLFKKVLKACFFSKDEVVVHLLSDIVSYN